MYLFNCRRKNKKIIYANVYWNTINHGHSQTSPLPIFPEGGVTSVHRLYDFWTILVHGRFDNSSHFVHVIDTHYIWAACGETGSYISLRRLSVQASQLPSFLFIIFIYNLLSDKTITQIKSIICWVNKHLLLLCYYLRILFPFLPYSIIFGVSCDFK